MPDSMQHLFRSETTRNNASAPGNADSRLGPNESDPGNGNSEAGNSVSDPQNGAKQLLFRTKRLVLAIAPPGKPIFLAKQRGVTPRRATGMSFAIARGARTCRP